MKSEPPTGDEMQTLLVSMKRAVLENAKDRPKHHRRTAGIVLGVVGVLSVASASGALALGALNAPAPDSPQAVNPTSTATLSPAPRSEPSITSAPLKGYSSPASQIPLDCAALGTAIGATSFITDASMYEYGGLWLSPADAMMRQSGVLSCTWSSVAGEGYPRLRVTISANTAGAHEWIASRRAAGDADFGVDAYSAVGCSSATGDCSLSMVGQRFWIDMEHDVRGSSLQSTPAVLKPLAQRVVDTLTPLAVRPSWQPPASSWSSFTSCADVTTTQPLSEILGVHGLVGPTVEDPGSETGIERTFGATTCAWTVPDAQPVAPESTRRVDVRIVPGGRWGYEQAVGNDAGGTSVHVLGAQDAVLQCSTAEGLMCWLDVLTDDSWMQVMVLKGIGSTGSDRNVLIRTAEAILAAHNSR